jgi:fumarate reductase flavoprotein subunit
MKINSNRRLRSLLSLTIFIMVYCLLIAGCSQKEAIYKSGTYVNEGEGYYSMLKVSVTVNTYKITDLQIISHQEPQILADIVFDTLPNEIIKKNSVDIDAVGGATYTSEALLEAVAAALSQAKVALEQ